MNEDVVHVDGDVAFIDEFAEKVIHHGLEGCRGICEAKEHDHWFKETAIRLERGLSLVTIAHVNVVVPPADIQFRKERRPAAVHSCESIYKLPDKRERGGIVNSERV